jgi:putative spermidine/putrescine transport system permease protein
MTRPLPRRARALTGAVLALWLVLPLLPLVIWSFARGWRFPDILPPAWSLQAWDHALSPRSGVIDSLGQTAVIAALATGLSILVGVPAGRALGLYRFRGRALVELALLAPVIVPGIAVGMGLHRVFLQLGLTGTLTGVVLAHLIPTLPYMTLVMTAVFSSHDLDVERQARSLGASPWQAFRHVTLPAILPGIVVGGLFAFLVSWSQYVLTLMIGGGRIVTLPMLLFSFAGAGRNDLVGAIAVIYVLPGVLILIVTVRRLTGSPVALAGIARR